MGVWSNGDSISFYHRKDPNYFEDIPAIPSAYEKLSDILTTRWTIDDLVKMDKLVNQKKSLKDLILEMEDEVLANAGVDVFEELFKLVFTKLYDEMEGGRDKNRHLVFKLKFPSFSGAGILENANFRKILATSNMHLQIPPVVL
jgi:type I restriction enzyme M protein